MARIKGIAVTLYEKIKIGEDAFHRPIYNTIPTSIGNVLVAPANSSDIPSTDDLDGAAVEYQLAIPKGDSHNWESGSRVDFYSQKFRTVGIPTIGIDENIPLDWNMKVKVERYE